MIEELVLTLSPRWRIVADTLQWIIQRKQGKKWRSIAFIASSKGVLNRVLREKGAEITPEGNAALDALPESYKEWVETKDFRMAAE
ncbi:MAG: hypothetical protein O2817_10015 [Proteobacteria bacterium]|nr:hypothetical protein [Pseudomonadota bacterium]